jgi:hypothetical protein
MIRPEPARPDHWTVRAECAKPEHRDLPWVRDEVGAQDNSALKAVCEQCPVTAECREYAITHLHHGFAAGTGAMERRRERIKRGLPAHYRSADWVPKIARGTDTEPAPDTEETP